MTISSIWASCAWAFECQAKPDDQRLRSELERSQAGYESVCRFALEFFDVYLKNQTARRPELVKKYRDPSLGGEWPHLEYLPVGATGAPTLPRRTQPPTGLAAGTAHHRRAESAAHLGSTETMARESTRSTGVPD